MRTLESLSASGMPKISSAVSNDTVINSPYYNEIPEMELQLSRITSELRPLQLQVRKQSGEVDSLLEEYESVMAILSECSTSWQVQ